MRRYLLRRVTRAVVVIVVGLWVPVLAGALWVGTQRGDLVDRFLAQPTATRSTQLITVVVAVQLLAIAAGVMVALRRIDELSGWMRSLAALAERFGETRIEPMRTGVAEIDQISDAIGRASAQVTRSLTAERAFASEASHQLRTPLTALLMRLDEISTTDDLDVVKEEAAVAIAQVDRLTRVVDDLLVRRRSDPQAATPEVSLDSVIAALQREWQPAFEQARRSVRVHGERGLSVRATPVALSQILSTLLENSLVHGRGTVDIHVRRSGPSVVVQVRDEGEGVSATMAPHIFERAVSSGRGSSTGLGLALARDLAESVGGRLDLVERVPATFALFLSEAVTYGAVR